MLNNRAHTVAEHLVELRRAAPLVQCITNSVVTNVTANVLLALGASAAMADVPGEAGVFAPIASGLLVNLGTPHAEQRVAMLEAACAATAAGTPWVLDPVAIGLLPVRTALAEELLWLRPTVIRGNPSEILALAGAGAGGRGVDSTDSAEAALPAARGLARDFGSIVAVSGPVDVVTDGATDIRVSNGTELLTRVTGGGCALGAVIAAFASLGDDRLATTVAACAVYTIAAEQAAAVSRGPGSFSVAFLDALATVGADDVRTLAAIA
ncbi:hydroxyethylthiazole kinase [Cryobacterium roopkundense]|uniref:Hydroxyethylthiazole kinase n=1 Tax=Cryobacterium roopkundense TaxID=1001240 RepID=A0A099J5K3_9MICO|nr:hydroxyethylthiazole kinase [Cryobacterium roopkundense]KGJ72792.1 hydroxyethylthiazole kinase [Cryobacterium roopkundense]